MRDHAKSLALLSALLIVGCQASSDTASDAAGKSASRPAKAAAARPAPAPTPVVIPAGTALPLTLETGVSSANSKAGELIVARLSADVKLGDRVVLKQGSEVRGRVTAAVPSGRVKGRARLAFVFDTLLVNGRPVPIEVGAADMTAGSNKGNDAKVIGGGAGAGLIIGAIADGKKGAAIGTAVGAAAGTGVVLATKGKEVELPAGSAMTAKLEKDVRLTPDRS